MDALPIDIHSNKLTDWLISRRHCPKEWMAKVPAIREKIKAALLDMPENERILDLLKGGNINYFHCREIVDILRETEKDTKNIFGYYSSQRMKDWQEILDLYQRDHLFLAESAQILQRLVQYEIPSLRKAIQKAQHTITDSAKKEQDYAKQSVDSRNLYAKELKKFGIKGEHLKRELVELAADLPAKFAELGRQAGALNAPIAYFGSESINLCVFANAFRDFSGLPTRDGEVFLPLARRLARKQADFTVYEWKHEREPKEVQRPSIEVEEEKEVADDEIDFGDDEIDFCDENEIDFGEEIEIVGDDGGIVAPTPADDGIARFEDAFSVFEHHASFIQLVAELEELLTFVTFRLADENANDPAQVYIASLEQRPREIAEGGERRLAEWKKTIEEFLAALRDPLTRHLAKIRTSPSYVESLIEQLEQKRRLEHKYKQLEILAAKKQRDLSDEVVRNQEQQEILCDSARQLQGEIEDEISKLYKGREVNLIGEIAAVLYD
ncbi:CDK5RAP3-like protein [Aphelenchoides fujianensis]|nr:CDK5RAP3-like protein [Aphelenchoides fujianensis]